MVEVMRGTSEKIIAEFNTLQLYDFMTLSNLFLEVGLEFSGTEANSTQSPLYKYITGELT
jgi:hypothetical protein